MPIVWGGQAQRILHEAVHRRRLQNVAPAHDVRYPLQSVIDHDRQMIARGALASREEHVSPCRGVAAPLDGRLAFKILAPCRWPA